MPAENPRRLKTLSCKLASSLLMEGKKCSNFLIMPMLISTCDVEMQIPNRQLRTLLINSIYMELSNFWSIVPESFHFMYSFFIPFWSADGYFENLTFTVGHKKTPNTSTSDKII